MGADAGIKRGVGADAGFTSEVGRGWMQDSQGGWVGADAGFTGGGVVGYRIHKGGWEGSRKQWSGV